MRRDRWAYRARRDFIRITDFFASRNPDYPDKLLDINALAISLADQPGRGSDLPSTPFQKKTVSGTDYILLYKATRRELVIGRVRHAKEDWRPL